MLWTFFVLDFDNTYDTDDIFSDGVQPEVYLVPKDKIDKVREVAKAALEKFKENHDGDRTIGDYFNNSLAEDANIDFIYIGNIDLTFEERMGGYLDESIPVEYL